MGVWVGCVRVCGRSCGCVCLRESARVCVRVLVRACVCVCVRVRAGVCVGGCVGVCPCSEESVLFIGTQFSILYTFMYSPA